MVSYMILKKNELIQRCGVDVETARLIMKYQKELPILTEDGEGFCINARQLHVSLGLKRKFADWQKQYFTSENTYGFAESVDYQRIHVDVNPTNGVIFDNFEMTLDMAKEISMISKTENGRLARKYFISCERVLKDLYEWNMIRFPEKKLYKEMSEELRLFLLRNYDKEAKFYDYSNEADALNMICLGSKAKDIKNFIEAQDDNTRDWLTKQYNEYLCKMEELNISFLKINMEKERRYELLKQIFKATYPNASFLMANSDLKKNIDDGKYI